MYYSIPEEKKKKIIYYFTYTRKRIPNIAEEIDLPYEQVMWVIEQYNKEKQRETGKIITRGNYEDKEIDNKIYNLRNKGMSYHQIGKEVGLCKEYISKRCKIIYTEKGEEEPKANKKVTREIKNTDIDNEIIRLRQEGNTFEKIGKILPGKKKMDRREVHRRYKKAIKRDNKMLANEIVKFATRRKLTIKQMQKMADYYGVDLEEILNLIEER